MNDLSITRILQQFVLNAPYGKGIGVFLAQWLLIVLFGVSLVVGVAKRWSLASIAMVTAAVTSSFALVILLGMFIQRIRPFRAYPEQIQSLIGSPMTQFSMPSGHAAAAFGLAVAVSMLFPTIRVPLFIGAVLVSVGRVIAGVHYPSDVIMGACLGALISWGMMHWLQRV